MGNPLCSVVVRVAVVRSVRWLWSGSVPVIGPSPARACWRSGCGRGRPGPNCGPGGIGGKPGIGGTPLPVAARTALTIHVLSDWPRLVASSSARTLRASGSRSVIRDVSAPSSSGDTTVVSAVSMAWVSSARADGPAPTTTKTGSRPCRRTSTDVPSSSLVISAAACERASMRARRADESSAKPIRSAACSVSGPIALAAWARSRRSASTYSVMSMCITMTPLWCHVNTMMTPTVWRGTFTPLLHPR